VHKLGRHAAALVVLEIADGEETIAIRRDIDEHPEFLMFTLWDSLDSVKAFAGPDYETAVFYPEDDRFLVERDQFSTHYFVHTHIAPAPDRDEVGDPGR